MRRFVGKVVRYAAGRITSSSTSHYLSGVVVTVNQHVDTTNAAGYYELVDIPVALNASVSASKEGYKTQSESVAIDEETRQDFSLEPAESEDDGSGTVTDETRPIGSTVYYYAITGLVGLLLVIAMIGVFMFARKR